VVCVEDLSSRGLPADGEMLGYGQFSTCSIYSLNTVAQQHATTTPH